MDASASNDHLYQNKLCCNIQNNICLPTSLKGKSAIVKYTKLPEFDFDTRVSWPHSSYTLPPRLRRIIELNDPTIMSTRSLKYDATSTVIPKGDSTKRKIVTIIEDDESDLNYKSFRPHLTSKTINRAVSTDLQLEKQLKLRSTSKTVSKESKQNKKTNASDKNISKKELKMSKISYKSKNYNINNLPSSENIRNQNSKEKESSNSSINSKTKYNHRKKVPRTKSGIEVNVLKNILFDNFKNNNLPKTSPERSKSNNKNQQKKPKVSLWDEIKTKNKPISVIHAPLDKKEFHDKSTETPVITLETDLNLKPLVNSKQTVDCGTEIDRFEFTKNANVETDALFNKVDQYTGMNPETILTHEDDKPFSKGIQFDCLDIPNVTLTKDSSREETFKMYSKSLPNLNLPMINKEQDNEETSDPKICKNSSIIIGQATVTYTTKQKINFHVVSSDDTSPSLSPSPLAYPINVVSVLKKQLQNGESKSIMNNNDYNHDHCLTIEECCDGHHPTCRHNLCNDDTLVPSSEIISSIKLNSSLLQNDHMSEQFQRELNFIDSFLESLQYLENCSLSDRRLPDHTENFVTNPEFSEMNSESRSFMSTLENGTSVEDTETMASKSLCLLNLLIRDEQRRAKDLLFVLKMREEALTDFTKSHILWLENKKKQDNTDISTLKKKQRGALIKLQSECGEMQRMRKALLAISEKRKAALMKTKKNIELKLKNTVTVDQILLNKHKLKKNNSVDRQLAPIKCFELSSSGCDEILVNQLKIEKPVLGTEVNILENVVTSAEKSVQTGDSIIECAVVDNQSNVASESCVVVDGTYLNILFQNLCLPPIFAIGKEYEVNEEALKNIVNSSVMRSLKKDECSVETFIEQKIPDQESSSPSTAHSLVEELDMYYKGLIEEDKTPEDSTDADYHPPTVYEEREKFLQVFDDEVAINLGTDCLGIVESDGSCKSILLSTECQTTKGKDLSEVGSQTGPLPVPVGATHPEDPVVDFTSQASSSVSSEFQSVLSLSSLATPVYSEAEELRRQQLAIEREIKALEQQQNQLMVVREIPDKPPPPYTPPIDTRIPKLPQMFTADELALEKVELHLTKPDNANVDPTDAFDVFLKDYCAEAMERHDIDQSIDPWDACNMLPQKPELGEDKLTRNTSEDLVDLLSGVAPSHVSGVSTRRSDHIDDILFAEWRRCEPEWTNLHVDEVVVKNQVFECIFQNILTETIDHYKKVVCNPKTDS